MSEQVTISIPNSVSADPTKTFESMTLDSVDGRNNRNRSSGGHENVNDRGHNSRNNHGSGRRRSSRSPSPSRTRRNIDVGVRRIKWFFVVKQQFKWMIYLQQAPLADRDFSISTFDVDPLLVTDIPRRTSRECSIFLSTHAFYLELFSVWIYHFKLHFNFYFCLIFSHLKHTQKLN